MPSVMTTAPGSGSGLWWRSKWMESIYTADDLKPLEVLVATVYADHAHDKRVAWVTGGRLIQRTKLSRDAMNRALKGLESKGYLVAIERRHRRPTVYGLVIPEHRLSTGDGHNVSTPDGHNDCVEYASRTQLVRETDTTSTGDVLHPSTYPSSPSHALAPADDGDAHAHHDRDATAAQHRCDLGWINNSDGTVSKCPTCKSARNAA